MPEDIKVGEIAFLKLTGEPIFVLAKNVPVEPGYGIQSVQFSDFIVRRYVQGRDVGSYYSIEYFTAAELTTQSPNNPEDILNKLFANAAQEAETIEVEAIPEIEIKPAVN
jgi:hypothetical protein